MRINARKDLDQIKAQAKAEIDFSAETYRKNFITPGSGQAMTYDEKYQEALEYQSNPSLPDSEIPHIVAEVGITGSTKAEVAQVIIDTRNAWKATSSGIESKRLLAKAQVDQATTPAQVDQAKVIDWS